MPIFRYVNPDNPWEDDETNSSAVFKKARLGKTSLQLTALAVTGRTYFKDKKEHDVFRSFEAKAAGADPESRVWTAWLSNRIECARSFNKKRINMTMPNLLVSFGNKAKRDIWFIDHREKVLQKPTAKELAASLNFRKDVDDMADRMKVRISNLEETKTSQNDTDFGDEYDKLGEA